MADLHDESFDGPIDEEIEVLYEDPEDLGPSREERRAGKRRAVGIVVTAIIVALGAALLFIEHWLFSNWDYLSVDEILYHFKVNLDGVNPDMVAKCVFECAIPIAAVTAVVAYVLYRLRKSRRAFAIVSCCLLAASVLSMGYAIHDADQEAGLLSYAKFQLTGSEGSDTFIRNHYVNPLTADLEFPKEKRNLVYIYLESMETTYMDKAFGGAFERNVIPELTELARQNEDFSGGSAHVAGAIALHGSTWTMGAMFAQTSGLPLKMPLTSDQLDREASYFPGIESLGDILERRGYRQALLLGSDAVFGGRDLYFKAHGDYDILDYQEALGVGDIPEDYFVFWGHEDEKLFERARATLLDMADDDRPFNLTMLTVDTHFEDGYRCRLCGNEFGDDQYANAMACSSRQVAEFVKWIQKQDFYENTTIIIAGDHPTMDIDFCEDVPEDYQRKTYFTVINGAASPANPSRERVYSTMDLFPTTLAALGVKIDGERLGMGTNLYSDEDTLLESLGMDACSDELGKPSRALSVFSGTTTSEPALKRAAASADVSVEQTPEGSAKLVLKWRDGIKRSQVVVATAAVTGPDGEEGDHLKLSYEGVEGDAYVYGAELDETMDDLDGSTVAGYLSVAGVENYVMARAKVEGSGE
ncbi:MAG: LTA synthase family protein [Coriobacteriales bacterium]